MLERWPAVRSSHDLTATGPEPTAELDDPCAATDTGRLAWPGIANSTGTDAAQLAERFSSTVLGTDGTAETEIAGTPSGCLVVIDHGSAGKAEVLLQTAGDQLVVAGYTFPTASDDTEAGLGLTATGDTVHVNFARTACPGCQARLAVRYGDAQASGPLDATGEGTLTIEDVGA